MTLTPHDHSRTYFSRISAEKMASNLRAIGAHNIEIWVDKDTGVNYLYHVSGYSGGLTPLLDREGKPVISPVANR